ncbi:MAG: hypothetical protein ABFC84_16010 [Veillonellales bacterium]
MTKLITYTLTTFLIGLLILGPLLFLPAGTFVYWQAWVFIAVFLVCVNGIGVYLSLKGPALLERRRNVGPAKEQRPGQRIVMALAIDLVDGDQFVEMLKRFSLGVITKRVEVEQVSVDKNWFLAI